MDPRIDRSEDLLPRFRRMHLVTEWHDVVNEGPPPRATFPRVAEAPAPAGEKPWICRAGSWLFFQGGMSAIILLGLMAYGLISAFLGY
jgi:hypothetical protein